MIYFHNTLYREGSAVSFQCEVIESPNVYLLKSKLSYPNELEGSKACAQFLANYPKTPETLATYFQEYGMEVQILGLVQ